MLRNVVAKNGGYLEEFAKDGGCCRDLLLIDWLLMRTIAKEAEADLEGNC